MNNTGNLQWRVLGIPAIRPHLLRIARNALLVIFCWSLTIWVYRIPLSQFPRRFGIAALIVCALAIAADLGALLGRWRWHRFLRALAPELMRTIAELGLKVPLVLYSSKGLCLAWSARESAFEMLVASKKPEASLLAVNAPAGFTLEHSTLETWNSFSRTDIVEKEECRRGSPFADRVPWKDFGAVALRGATSRLAAQRVLELLIRAADKSTMFATPP